MNPLPFVSSLARGQGAIEFEDEVRLVLPPQVYSTYSNAQLDDYRDLPRSQFLHRPPLKLKCKVRWDRSSAMVGTSGFGFWNDPFMMTGWRCPSLPQAFWFFYGCPKSKLSLEQKHLDHHGLRCFQVNAWNSKFLKKSPTWILRAPWMMRHQWTPELCRDLECSETFLPHAIDVWHAYEIHWLQDELIFSIDGDIVQRAPWHVSRPLGLVIWMDNQYLTFDPWRNFRWGNIPVIQQQALWIKDLSIHS